MISKLWKPILPPFRKHKRKIYSQQALTSQFIYQIGELELLRKPSKPVSLQAIKTPEFQTKLKYLKKCLLKYRSLTGMGRGIAAVQIGIPETFSVIYIPEIKNKLLVVINPKITKDSYKFLKYPEICMSSNPIVAPVVRPAWVEFEYYDEEGKKHLWNTKDTTKKGRMYNRVFQHELDHMKGIINIDLVNSKELILDSDPKFYKNATFEEIK